MRNFLLILAGIGGGVLGGLGFGGGTLLVPILVFFFGVPAKVAAWINLVSFLPMAVVALIIHTKNKMIDFPAAIRLFMCSLIGAGVVFLFVRDLSDCLLKKFFGCFLLFLGISSLLSLLVGYFKKKRKESKNTNK